VFTADVTTPCAIRCPTSPTPHWQETGKPSRQASLIIDPLDGRQPPLSPEGQARQAQQQAEAKARAARLQGREADSYLDRSLYDRCITRGVMGSLPADHLQQRQRDRAGAGLRRDSQRDDSRGARGAARRAGRRSRRT
jgi:hypothetical protein